MHNVLQAKKNAAGPEFSKDIKDKDLDRYFQPSKLSESVHVDVVENALLPTRMYYQKFSDHARLWINEESTT